jgi:hypothetical protein
MGSGGLLFMVHKSSMQGSSDDFVYYGQNLHGFQ